MKLRVQKRIAAIVAKTSPKKIRFDPAQLEAIKEGITKLDIRGHIGGGAIRVSPKKGTSRGRARKKQKQKSKGLRRGHGSRKGSAKARSLGKKKNWMNKIRTQRELIKALREKEHIDKKTYRSLYLKAKGGFFRSRRHIKLYVEENKLVQTKK